MLAGVEQKTTTSNGGSYFVMATEGNGIGDIWFRQGKKIKPFLMSVDQAPQYTKRFRFFEMGHRVIQKRFLPNFHKAMDKAIASSIR